MNIQLIFNKIKKKFMSALINFINESTPKRMIFVKIEPALAH